jgi:hypothetical protein
MSVALYLNHLQVIQEGIPVLIVPWQQLIQSESRNVSFFWFHEDYPFDLQAVTNANQTIEILFSPRIFTPF